jgi:6-pyruvoyl-tetrahydropterin synthase
MIQFYTLEEVKAYAKKLLEETDYAVLLDVNLTNKHEFVTYRNLVRLVYFNPIINPYWPEAPKAIWKHSDDQENNANQPLTDLPVE